MNKKSLRYLAKVDEFANNNNISIVYFTSPLYSEFIQKMNINLIINQMREVVRSIGSIYDLRCMPNLSSNSKNFSSPNHAGYYLLKKAVNSLNKEFLVSEKNIDKFYKNKWRECF